MNIKKIAQLANSSASSVSRVINNSGYVKAEVRQRIQRVLDETGYRPNAFAKALHSKKSHTIGVILPKINATSSGETVAGINHFFNEKGYSILLGNTDHNLQNELNFIDLFTEKQVDGLIFIATVITEAHRLKLEKLKIPVVVIGQKSPAAIPCVLFDEYHAAKEMVNYLIQQRKRRIALIGVDEQDISVGVLRRQGYLDALREHGITPDPLWQVNGQFTHESGFKACQTLLTQNNEYPEAIFALNDKMAIGAMNYLFSIGLDVPETINVCGVGGGMLAQFYHPKLTTLFYDYKQSGLLAAELLYPQLQGEPIDRTNSITRFAPYHFILGESTDSSS